MSSERKENHLGQMASHTSRKAALGEILAMLRAIKAGRTMEGEEASKTQILWLMMSASVGMKSIARSECHRNELTHAELEREYIEATEEMAGDMPLSPVEQTKLELMGIRSPELAANEDMPVSDIQHGLYDISLTAEDAREDFILGGEYANPFLLLAVARITYNARSMLNMICESYGMDPEGLLQVADDAVQESAEETGAIDLIEELKRRMEEEDGN